MPSFIHKGCIRKACPPPFEGVLRFTPFRHPSLRLIHVVVQNVGLEDKVGALTALRLLKADDTSLQKLLKAGVLPSLLRILSEPEPTAGGERQLATLRLTDEEYNLAGVRAAETAAAAARAVEAFASSVEAQTTLLRGGAVEALTRYLTAHGEMLGTSDASLASRRAGAAASCVEALSRMSKSSLASDAFDGAGHVQTSDAASSKTTAAASVARSLLALLESDAAVVHREAAAGFARLTASSGHGRTDTVAPFDHSRVFPPRVTPRVSSR